MKYKSELINEIVENEGHNAPSLHYESECIDYWIESIRGAYPKLTDYEGEWLNYYLENGGIGKFPYLAIDNIISTTIENTVPIQFKSAILKGNTKYRDIDTGDILDTFDETKNLELVSVKMPVLTTSNEDGTKTNILTVNEDVEMRDIKDSKYFNGSSIGKKFTDVLDCINGELKIQTNKVTMDGNKQPILIISKENVSIFKYKPNDILINSSYDGGNIFICDKLKFVSALWEKDEEGYCYSNNEGIIFSINNNKFTDINEYLSQNPITFIYPLAQESIKTVDLSIIDESGNNVSKLKAMNGITHIQTSGTPLKPSFTGEIPVEAITENLESFIEEE